MFLKDIIIDNAGLTGTKRFNDLNIMTQLNLKSSQTLDLISNQLLTLAFTFEF